MDFHALVDKLKQLESQPREVNTQENCGMPATNPLPPPVKPDIPPPSLNVNLSAQGMDNIEQMMQLFKKVNPDMMPKIDPMPSMAPPPSIASINSLPPLKMLPDLDKEEPMDMMKDLDHQEPDGDEFPIKMLDKDGDGDHDIDDHNDEPKDDMDDMDDKDDMDDEDKPKKEWANTPDVEEKDTDYILNKVAGGMNKSHDTFPKVSDGDNPMQRVREEDELRSAIKAELARRLSEAKGVK